MEIFGIGAPELVFIIIIALIVLGPKDMQKAGRTIGRWLNELVHSDSWRVFQKTSRELRNLPSNLMREANMEMMKTDQDIRRALDSGPHPPGAPASVGTKGEASNLPPSNEPDHTIRRPAPEKPEDAQAPNT